MNSESIFELVTQSPKPESFSFAWVMIAVYGWFLLILLALIVAAFRLFRHAQRGLGRSAMLLGGILLLGAWVSAVIGCYEIHDYTQRPAFWVSLGIGSAGLIMASLGLRRIPPAKSN